MRSLLTTVIAASLSFFGLSGCGFLGSPEVHYKVTVEVDDGAVVRSGASVWSWTLSRPTIALASAYNGEFEGEAVAIDLHDGRTLFAILRGSRGDEGAVQMIPERLFGDTGRAIGGEPKQFGGDRVKDLRDIASRKGERRELDCKVQPDLCPMFVTFRDIERPLTVTAVDPQALDKSFGPGVRLRRVLIEVTDEPVTRGIEKRLEWLPSQVGALVKGPRNIPVGKMPLAGRLHEGDFSQ